MQVNGDISAYTHLSSRTPDESAVKIPAPSPVHDKGSASDTGQRSTAGTKTVISHNKAGGLNLYA